jgi:hypothetical protein
LHKLPQALIRLPSALKPGLFCSSFGTTEQAAEKVCMETDLWKDELAGAEARLILLSLLARLKPCPCYEATAADFFRNL